MVSRVPSLSNYGSIASVGLSVDINNIVVHVFIFMDVFVIGRVAICQLIRILGHGVSLFELHLEVKVFINDVILWVIFFLNLFVIIFVAVG